MRHTLIYFCLAAGAMPFTTAECRASDTVRSEENSPEVTGGQDARERRREKRRQQQRTTEPAASQPKKDPSATPTPTPKADKAE